ncbi:hypothetical protein C5167_017811 [Papaver somniferum]|uniref:Uncharacterized protein n=1 Tax=Papaver somniferum TaxID=3469 RepID=A0A4Y7INK1_PAPSO|nr:hypothetical protein C5167_017811 [Papaver somniferum]
MCSKNIKVFLWLALVAALLLMSSQVLTVKGLTEKKPEVEAVEATEKNGVENLKYEASLAVAGGAQCGSPGCCRFRLVSPRFVPTCLRCCP